MKIKIYCINEIKGFFYLMRKNYASSIVKNMDIHTLLYIKMFKGVD